MNKKKSRMIGKTEFVDTMLNLKKNTSKQTTLKKKHWSDFQKENPAKAVFRW